jgi:hypothetical protein
MVTKMNINFKSPWNEMMSFLFQKIEKGSKIKKKK